MKKIFVVLLLLASSFAFSQQLSQTEQAFKKIEKAYEKGDYKNGFKANKSLIKKLSASNGLELASAHFLAARGADLLGKFPIYDSYIISANNLFKQADKTALQWHAKATIYAVDAYMSYGDYTSAAHFLEDEKTVLDSKVNADTALLYELKERLVNIHFKQGFHIQAQNELPEIIAHAETKLGKYDYVFDKKKARVVKKKLSKEERIVNARKYAMLKDLEAEIALENGDYGKSSKLLKDNEEWIRTNISKKDIAYIHNQMTNGAYYELQDEFDKANKYFVRAENFLNRTKYGRYRSYSREAINVYESLVTSYAHIRKSSLFSKKRKNLEKRVKKYYGKNNYYYGKVQVLTASKDLFLGNWTKAISEINDVLKNTNIFPANHLERARALEYLALAQLEKNEFKGALNSLEIISDIKKRMLGENAPVYHMSQLSLANFYVSHSDDFKKAETIYKTSLHEVVSKEINHKHQSYLGFLEDEVALYQIEDKYEEAYKKAQHVLETAEENFGTSSVEYAVALVNASDVSIDVGKYLEAETNLDVALKIIENKNNNNDNAKLVYAMETMAKLQVILGNFELAEKLLSKALKISKRTSNEDKMSIAIEESAMLYIQTGQYSAIETKLLAVIRSKEQRYGKEHRMLVKPLNYLGYLYFVMGDYNASEKQLYRSMAISKKVFGIQSIKYAEGLNIQAHVYQVMGDFERALDLEQQVYAIQTKQLGKKHIVVANTLNEIALLKFYNKDASDTVELLFNESLDIISQNLGNNSLLYANVLKNKALFYIGINESEKAEKSLDKAYKIWVAKFGDKNKYVADYYYIKGSIDFEKKDFANANVDYVTAKNIYQSVFNKKHPDYIKALGKSAQLQYVLGDYKNAILYANESIDSYLNFISLQFPSLSERQKTKSWNVMRSDFEFYYSMALSLKDQNPELLGNVYNISMYTKALLLSSSVKLKHRILNSGDTILIQRYQSWISKKELLSQIFSMNESQLASFGYDVKMVEKEVEDLEKLLSESSELFAENYEKKSIDWKGLRKILAENEVAVDVIRYRKFDKGFTNEVQYAALAVSANTKGNPEAVLFANGADLESKYLKYYRNCVRYNIPDEKSYDNFWLPIKTLAGSKSVIFFSPEGVFNQINLESIPVGSTKYVIDEREIVLVSNIKDLLLASYKEAKTTKSKAPLNIQKSIMLVGNPKYYQVNDVGLIQQLPGAEAEVKEISKTFTEKNWNVNTFLFDNADEINVRKVESPTVFHIATHGFFLEDVKQRGGIEELTSDYTQNPLLRSGLILQNGGSLLESNDVLDFNTEEGILTAYEAMNLNFDNTDLVVLSACETGLGDLMLGEGVYGLQRSFIVAGAHNVIMSLFKVPDVSTKELMVEFYNEWLETGDKRQAFLDAKKTIMKKYPEPINWGAFVMIGL